MKSKRRRFFATGPKLEFIAASPAPDAAGTIARPQTIAGTLRGYPLVWNVTSTDRFDMDGSYKVRLMPGSAKFVSPTFALFTHEFTMPVGNTANGSLRILPADDFGQPVEIDLPDTSVGRDVATLVRDGYISGMSFAMPDGFGETFETEEAGVRIVNCKNFTVDEVTVCADPAFVETIIAPAPAGEEDADEEEDDELAKARREKIRLFRVRLSRLRLHSLLSH